VKGDWPRRLPFHHFADDVYRLYPQQAFTENIGLSAEVRLSRQWLMALSGDPVGSCAGLLAGPGSALRYQLGLDLFWQRIY